MSRVVIVTRLYPPEVGAGAFRLGALGRAVAREGSEVTVLTTRPPKHAPRTPDPTDVTIKRWPVLRDRGGNVRGYVQYASFDAPAAVRSLFTRYDVAVAESPPTTGLVVAIASWLKRKPFVYYAADVWTDGVASMGAARIVVSIMRFMERAVLRRAAATISVSDEVTERLVLLGADRDRVATVGNGIATDIFHPDVPTPDEDGTYFVYTGTMSEWQQPDIFVRAFASIAREYPHVRLKFFGQGAVEGALRDVADELVPGRVDFGGVVSPAESASWIKGAVGALVSIVPGIGYDFAKPTKTYAAAAVGTPVLFAGPNTGGALVRDADLGMSTEFTVEAVAAAMRTMLADEAQGIREAERKRRSTWARENVSLSAVAHRVAQVIAQVSSSRASRMDTASSLGTEDRNTAS
ncbi:glycosyltransferase family 4 protein [Microbacterium sp. NC79]|uniref:glycosyltransferase family 4 protein n=1 Tax=Microbacterium sp. NC79 TaxID=2851009 RepID=UPI001C2C8681|nr:glycosyltransferase family 4 protein [Microbacterium sp. NC79]